MTVLKLPPTPTAPGAEVVISLWKNGGVSVADRGPGVAAGDRERIFERFWRGTGFARAE